MEIHPVVLELCPCLKIDPDPESLSPKLNHFVLVSHQRYKTNREKKNNQVSYINPTDLGVLKCGI